MSINLFVTDIDPAGDLLVEIPIAGDPNTVHTYRVCKRTMQRLYPVKNEFFSNAAGDIVKIPTAHPIGIVTIAFKIAHAFFLAAPDTIDEQDFFHLLKFTSKLGITQILRPYAKNWAAAIKLSEVGENGVSSERVFIAWELGDRASFDNMVTHVACASKKRRATDFREHLKSLECFQYIKHIRDQDSVPIIDRLVVDIEATRVEAIQIIYNLIGKTMEALATEGDGTPKGHRICHHHDAQDACEIFLLGSVYQLLFESKLCAENRVKPDRQAQSVHDLIDHIRDIEPQLKNQDLRYFFPKMKHPRCSRWLPLFINLEGTVDEFSVLSLRHFEDYFKEQGKLTGFVVESSVMAID
ncbi:hypothetical protein PGQ11_010361 [Apiospora arundinis]|uniref:Uncharacterized protein n=1 Tax=Apiospora arundinis TaxID=335852 RepID=A0ABR2I9Y7_9PEZI